MTEIKKRVQHSELVESQIRHNYSDPVATTARNWLQVGDIMTEDIASVSSGTSIISAAKIMSDKNISCLVVLDNENLTGIITETDLLKKAVAKGNDFRNLKIEEIMSSPVRSYPRDLSVLEASKIMEAEKIRRLVIVEEDRAVGIITQTDIVRTLTTYSMWKNVEDLMTPDVASISISATVKEAAALMASRDISCLVVMDKKSVVGIFTERDLLKRVVALKRDPSNTIVKNVMSSPVLSVPSNYSIPSASKMIEKKKIRRLLVMNDQQLLGVVTQTDILKAIKNHLQEEEENYIQVLNESRNCIFMVDSNNNTTYANPAFMELLDVTNPEELINQPFLPERFWENPNKRDYILEQLDKASVEVHDLTLRTSKGKKLFVTLFSTRTKNIKGQTNGNQVVIYDITAKKELANLRVMEQKLRRTEDLLRGTLESTADGILVVNEKGRISHMNNRFAKIWDISENICRQQIDEELLEHISSMLEKPSDFLNKLQAIYPDNQDNSDILYLKQGKILEVFSQPLIREGRFAGRVWTFHDITKIKQAEEALNKAHNELEKRVEQRTAELEQVNKELQEFTYIAAHDLKTPLRGIGTLADWLLTDYSDKFDEHGQMQVKLLVERAKRSDKLVDSILQYSTAGHSIEKREQVDLKIALYEIIHEIEPPENIEIIIDNNLPILICNKTHISQIFENLIRNAIKYMDKEKGQIEVGCIEEGGFWKFNITDNGPGIDNKYHEKIFKIFQTLSQPDETESTGIGLSVAKKIIEINHGRIWIESNPGEGSTFFFTLPKADSKYAVKGT
jgi:PAS domain S-box-containing protein